jgi:DNA-binding protein H-NS
MREQSGVEKATIRAWAFVAGGAVVIVLLLNWALLFDSTDRGTFGDMFGAANALFSGLAFIGVIVAVMLQSRELALQRQELKETRDEITRQAMALEEQVLTAQRQRFETTLFNLLELKQKQIADFNAYQKDGVEALRSVAYETIKCISKADSDTGKRSQVAEGIANFWKSNHAIVQHYVQTVEVLLSFLIESGADADSMDAATVASQFSLDELQILLFVGILPERVELRSAAERLRLFRFLPLGETAYFADAAQCYSTSAFQ